MLDKKICFACMRNYYTTHPMVDISEYHTEELDRLLQERMDARWDREGMVICFYKDSGVMAKRTTIDTIPEHCIHKLEQLIVATPQG